MRPNPRNSPCVDLRAMSNEISQLQAALRTFANDRDWGQFHSPKNLAAALSVEAAELLEHFQWLTEAQSSSLPAEKRALVAEEVADVLLYLLQLSDRLQIDVMASAWKKIEANSRKYPVEKSQGSMRKYNEF